jgi:antitoxin component YwqK of YwqJK toxin-antitoxin module
MTDIGIGNFDSEGKKHGVWIYNYNDNSMKVKRATQFVHGVETGYIKFWYRDGRVMDFSYWDQQTREGEQLEFFYHNDTIEID